MNKSELIDELSVGLNQHPRKTEHVVNTILNSMIKAMKESRRIEIRGFGSFVMREYRTYTGRNPKTGEKIKVKPKKLPFFKTGKDMKDRVDS